MRGMLLTFTKSIQRFTDAMNNPIVSKFDIDVDDVLIAPISEPTNAREEQAMKQSIDQLRVHIPKTYTGDLSDTDFVYGNKLFHVDSDSVIFMPENTPTRWNRYFRAQFVSNYVAAAGYLFDGILSEDGLSYFVAETNLFYFAQEVVL